MIGSICAQLMLKLLMLEMVLNRLSFGIYPKFCKLDFLEIGYIISIMRIMYLGNEQYIL